MVRVTFPTEARDLSLFHSVQTASGANPASYLAGIGGSFPWGTAARGLKLITHLSLMSGSRMEELYLHFPIRLHDVLLDLRIVGLLFSYYSFLLVCEYVFLFIHSLYGF
jgi:hypothetical protein